MAKLPNYLPSAAILAILILLAFPPSSFAGLEKCRCYCGKLVDPPCPDEKCKQACGWSGGSGSSSSPSYDEEAERQRRLEEERRRRLEAERERQREIGEQRRREEEEAIRRQQNFNRQKQEVLGTMKDIGEGGVGSTTGGLGLKDISESASGLQEGGVAGTGLGLKDIDDSSGLGDKKMDAGGNKFQPALTRPWKKRGPTSRAPSRATREPFSIRGAKGSRLPPKPVFLSWDPVPSKCRNAPGRIPG